MYLSVPLLIVWLTSAQAAPPAQPAPATAVSDAPEASDTRFDRAQPDFTLVALPTTLRVPLHKSAFRVTHRFLRSLGEGSFGDLAGDLFSLDSGAQIGLEYRYGLLPGAQVGINRTSDKTIQFFTEYDLLRKTGGNRGGLGLSAWASVDGTNNFRDSYTPALGAIVSRELGTRGAVYAEPMWVNNSNPLPSDVVDHNDTFILGLGGRARLGDGVYIVGEVTPRASGFKPGVMQGSFGLEGRVGGHVFQINFSNGFGTTIGQIARGGLNKSDWHLGFNISRKFF
jgi:hypothetical protein